MTYCQSNPTRPSPKSRKRSISWLGARLLIALTMLVGMSRVAVANGPHATVVGQVTLTAADGEVFPTSGVRLTLICGTAYAPATVISDDTGAFRFDRVSVGTCSITAELPGFKPVSAATIVRHQQVTSVDLHLVIEPLYTGMMVTGAPGLTPRRQERALTGRVNGHDKCFLRRRDYP